MTTPTDHPPLTQRLFRNFRASGDAIPRGRLPGHTSDINPSIRAGFIDMGEALAGDAIESDEELERIIEDLAAGAAKGEGCEPWDPEQFSADDMRDREHARDLSRRETLDTRRTTLERHRREAEAALAAADPLPPKPRIPLMTPLLNAFATGLAVFLTIQALLEDMLWGRQLFIAAGVCALFIGLAITVPVVSLARNEASRASFHVALAAGLAFAVTVLGARYAIAQDLAALSYSIFAFAIEAVVVVLTELVLFAWRNRIVDWRAQRDHQRNLRRRIDEAQAALQRLRPELEEVEGRISAHHELIDTRTHGALARSILEQILKSHIRFGLVGQLRDNFHRLIGAPRATKDQIIPFVRDRA